MTLLELLLGGEIDFELEHGELEKDGGKKGSACEESKS